METSLTFGQRIFMRPLKERLNDSDTFTVLAELMPGRGYTVEPIRRFLSDYAASGNRSIPPDFDFAAITLPQNPGGVSNLDPSDILTLLSTTDLPNHPDFIPHISCKDHNQAALNSLLTGYRQRGVQSVLALTGDKPTSAKGVFDREAVGLLQLISENNRALLLSATPGRLAGLNLLFPGAAVSPYKYTEASQMQQYFKMEKKAASGARFFITQVGWDWRKARELMLYRKETGLTLPILGNAYFLTTTNSAPHLMNAGRLPGCFVSDALLARLKTERFEEQVERCARQIAMYRSLGYDGVDIGGVHEYELFCRLLNRAAEIGDTWSEDCENLCWPPENPFYLYDDQDRRIALSPNKPTRHDRWFDRAHNHLLDPECKGFRTLKKIMDGSKENGTARKSLFAVERAIKHSLFECTACGDCYLVENFGYCTMGGCAKGLANAPCGDAKPDGTCGNAEGVICRGEQIYKAAKARSGGLTRLRQTINRPRNPALQHTSSILNYLFGKDHTMKNAIITIGEDIHASIPKHGAVMRDLHRLGETAYSADSPQLEYIRALIESQAADGADYIAVNVDAFGESDPQLAVRIMKEYVRLVRRWGGTVPVCIDSSDDQVLIAGLKEWYRTDCPVKKPLVNSIKVHTADKLMSLRKEYDFVFIGMLTNEKGSGAGNDTVEDLVALARQIHTKAMEYGFENDAVIFDTTAFPLAIDMPMMPGTPGYTYRAFETIKALKALPEMKGVHFSMGISNSCRDLPGRKIGIMRAYVEVAMRYGLDAGIVNARHRFGTRPADPKLVKLVSAYAAMDGSLEKTNDAIELMGEFCDSLRT
ncbi:hypothetical protein EGM51_03055 [Verrucomicrobia bacterium S94]|nr:hypothetical protein EGM51_03055 [Verrucomicrobia bacterium S94]